MCVSVCEREYGKTGAINYESNLKVKAYNKP